MLQLSSPRQVVDRMKELMVRLLLVENVWRQKQSWSFMHLLCSGMVGFGLRQNWGQLEQRATPPSFSFPEVEFVSAVSAGGSVKFLPAV